MRANQFADWLSSETALQGHANVVVFDLFHLLADENIGAMTFGMLKAEYRGGADSHPNETAGLVIGPQLAEFIVQAIQAFK